MTSIIHSQAVKLSNLRQINFFISAILFFCILITDLHVFGQTCTNNSSTNPDLPNNDDPLFDTWENLWLNSFDVGKNNGASFSLITLNPSAGWTDSGLNDVDTLKMFNPFSVGAVPNATHLSNPFNNFTKRDFHWEDGWELLYLGTGFYPNGDPLDVIPANSFIDETQQVPNGNIPYMVYYNRYSSIVRVFLGVFVPFGAAQNLTVDLSLNKSLSAEDDIEYNGLLRHLNAYDSPLDQETPVIQHRGENTTGVDFNIRKWYVFDFQVGYDPCICNFPSVLDLDVSLIDISSMSLYGRVITVEEPLTDAAGNPIYNEDFLTASSISEQDPNGYILQSSLEGLIESYNTSLQTYQNSLDDRQFGQIGWMRDLLDNAVNIATGDQIDITSSSGAAQFLVDASLELGADSSDFEELITKSVNGLLGQGYNFFSSMIMGNNAQPTRPSRPVANFSEMRLNGKIETTNTTSLSGFLTPGSDINLGGVELSAHNYPAYNEILGLYATLKTPRPDVLLFDDLTEEDTLNILTAADSSEYLATNQFPPVYIHYDTTIVKSKTIDHAVYLRLTESLEYALNNAVDFDMDETQIYFSCQVTLENGLEWSYSDVNMIDSVSTSFSDNTNLWPLHDIKNIDSPLSFLGNSQRRIELTSGWYEIEDITDLLFGTTFESTTYYKEKYEASIYQGPGGFGIPWEDEFNTDIPDTDTEVIKFRPVKIELKILADMNFEQLSSTGEEINTTQVFTYLVYDEDKSVNFLGNDGDFVSESNISSFVNMFPGDLTIESNILFPNAPEIFISNFGSNLFAVVADNIIINDDLEGLTDSNGQGFVYDLQAYTKIHLQEGAHLSPNLHLEINRDIYGGPTSLAASASDLQTFCSDTSQYAASTASRDVKSREAPPSNAVAEAGDLTEHRGTVQLYPNPARDLLTLRSSHLDISAITIHDLSGRPIKQEILQSNSKETQVNLLGIAPGTYIVRVDCGDEVFSEKLVVTK